MSKIKFGALGGLGEHGKNMYMIDVDGKILILDAGLKHPSFDLFGVDAVIPNMSYLIENKDRVQGIFLSHGHDDHIGAIPELLKKINVGVFGTRFTMALVELALSEANMNISDYRLYRINDEKVLKFGNVSVVFYSTNHSIPESVGIAIKTEDGALVYATDFSFTSNPDPKYQTNYGKILEVAKDGVLALLSESVGTSNINRVSNDYAFFHNVIEILQNSKRVIFSTFSNELQRIQKIINICVQQNRKVAIIGKKVQKTINIAMNNDYLKIPSGNLVNLKYISDEITNDDEDLAVIVTGSRHEPYYTLQRMASGVDRLINITENDHIVIISQPTIGTEIMAAKAIGLLHRLNAKVTIIPKDMLLSSHADSEDLRMLYDMLKPKYIVPIAGEYRHQFMQRNIALDSGYADNHIVMLDNGDVITFENGNLVKATDKIPTGDVLVDGSIVGDINEVVLKDRELLAGEGLILVVTSVDARLKKIVAGPKVVLKGFFAGATALDTVNSLTDLSQEVIEKYFSKRYVDWNDLKNLLKEAINKEIYRQTKKSPIIMPVLIDVETKKE